MNIWYSLFDVVARGQRDREYLNVIYYFSQPFIGIVFGLGALLLVVAIFRLFGNNIETSRFGLEFIMVPSFVAGSQQRAILRIINRFIHSFRLKVNQD